MARDRPKTDLSQATPPFRLVSFLMSGSIVVPGLELSFCRRLSTTMPSFPPRSLTALARCDARSRRSEKLHSRSTTSSFVCLVSRRLRARVFAGASRRLR